MGTFSIWHWLIVLAVVMILFGGGGKISRIMGDMAKGVKAFKKGLKEEGEGSGGEDAPAAATSAKTIPASGTVPGATPAAEPVRRDEQARG
jgi:sec-independent protein translocase protein TatA